MSKSEKSGIAPWQWALGVAVLAALVAGWFLLPIKDWADSFQGWIQDLGPWGWLIFAAVYIVGTVLLVPVSILTIIAGLAFGLPIGFPLVVVSATIGATLAFLVARYLAKDKVESLMSKRPKFKAIKAAVSEGGWKVVGLLRLSPVLPFNLQNYFYGVTDITLLHYVPATFVGIMPGTLLYVYLGAAGKAASGDGGGALKWTFFGIGLLVTVVVAVFVTRKAKQKLKEHGVGDKGDSGDKDNDKRTGSSGQQSGAQAAKA